MTSSPLVVVIAALVAGSAACRSKEASSTHDSASAANAGSLEGARKSDSSGKGSGTAGMPVMAGTPSMVGSAMMDSMQAHMRMMTSTTADQMAATLPTHRQMVANMLSQMTAEMRSMNTPADAAWKATIDSMRQDLIRLPVMTKPELKQAMPAHLARVSRVMQIHKDMMAKMGK